MLRNNTFPIEVPMRLITLSVSMTLMFTAVGCAQLEQGADLEPAPSSIARVLGIASVEECPNGGVELEYGIDANLNGSLDDEEVTGSYSVCHGEAGADGKPCVSAPKDDGTFEITCPDQDPIVIEAGPQGEPGPKGETGPTGETGAKGEPGNAGEVGPEGMSTLVATGLEAPGDNCTEGGFRIDSGLDADDNGSLDEGEITSSSYVCNGAAGNPGKVGEKGEKGDPGVQGDKGEAGFQGDKGDAGVQGDKGEAGFQGDKGEAGVQGDKGEAGVQGDKGEPGFQGDKGDKGDKGNPGVQGDKGDIGSPGVQGDKGDPGVQGGKGDTGAPGVKGDQGPAGLLHGATHKSDGGVSGNAFYLQYSETGSKDLNSVTITVPTKGYLLINWSGTHRNQLKHNETYWSEAKYRLYLGNILLRETGFKWSSDDDGYGWYPNVTDSRSESVMHPVSQAGEYVVTGKVDVTQGMNVTTTIKMRLDVLFVPTL
jgi:hypothetical protein